MFKNTNIEVFLEQLAQGVEDGTYTKATFPKALDEKEWAQFIDELTGKSTVIGGAYIAPFQFIGILPSEPPGTTFTYSDLCINLTQRFELIKFAKEHIKDFTAVRH
jgi:hypothetical protein